MNNNLWKPIAFVLLTTSLLLGCNGQSTIASDPGSGDVILAEALPEEYTETVEEDHGEAMDDSKDDSNTITRPDGWTEETHGKSTEPAYDVVFSQAEVNRVDITIAPETWQAMLDDMTDHYSESGTRQNADGAPAEPFQRPQAGAQGEAPFGRPEDNAKAEMPDGRPAPEDNAQARENLRRGPVGGMDRPGGGLEGIIDDSDTNPIWVPVALEFKGTTWTNVGMRFKGNSSLRSTWQQGNLKIPFRLDFDQFEDDFPEIDDQRFYGFQKVTFSSNFNDASFLREKITADLFRMKFGPLGRKCR